METCSTCPSFLPADEVPVVFGKVTGAPMCARYGHVLGKPGLSESGTARLQEVTALRCDAYGKDRPAKPVDFRTRIAVPDPAIVDRAGQPDFKPAELSTCRSCTNLVRADTVATEIGYTVDLCKAKGTLITRPQHDCKGCPLAVAGPISVSTDGVELRAEFKEGFVVPTDLAVNKVVGHSNSQQEPSTYETDAEVSDEDRSHGIRAWRKVTDPHGSGNEVFMPIFDPAHFTDEERLLIPQTGDQNHPELYIDYAGLLYSFVVEMVILRETLCLQGPPGVGKTEFARWAAWLMQMPFHRFSFNSRTEVEDMIGKMMYSKEKGTYFQWGRIPKVYETDCVVVYDELNLADNAIREALRPTFDNSRQLVLDAGEGEMVNPGRFTFAIVAQNDSWDFRNIGTNEAADPDANRLSVVHVDLPPDAVERHIIIERCKLDDYDIPSDTLDMIMAVSEDIREMSKQKTVPFTWGVRQTIKVARKTRWYNLVDAFKRAALDFYEPETTEMVLQTIRDRIA